MSLVIYLGLNAFTHQPHLLLPPGQVPLPLQALQETAQQGTVLLDEMTESASQQLNQWLAKNAEQCIELCWPQPVPYIAARTAQGAQPHDVQQSWKAQAQRIVALFRKHRRQITLYGYTPGQAPSHASSALAKLPALDVLPLHRLAAGYLLKEDTELQQAHGYLKASSQATSEWQQDPVTDIAEALAQQQKLQDAELENQQYAQQLDQAQQTLEQQLHELEESSKAAEQAKYTEQALSQSKEEHSQITAELHKSQEALEKALKEKEQQTKQIKEVEEENELVIKELHRVQEALEQALIDQDQRQTQLKGVQKELKQRQAQLHSVQEELEKLHTDQQRLEKRSESRQRNLNVLRSESEQRIHHLQTLVQWLRVSAYRHASAAYRYSRAYKKALPRQISQIEESGFFDAQWYCEQYPDVAKAGIKPAEHFVKFGALEGRNPSASFDTEYYLNCYQDVAASGQHPLLHYIRNGKAEQRETQAPQRQLPAPVPQQVNVKERLA